MRICFKDTLFSLFNRQLFIEDRKHFQINQKKNINFLNFCVLEAIFSALKRCRSSKLIFKKIQPGNDKKILVRPSGAPWRYPITMLNDS